MASGLLGRQRSKDNFALAIDTLRRAHRSQLMSARGKSVIDQLYIDPLPNDGVLRKVLLPHMTLILGRRGTGKSTLIERAQSVLAEDRTALSAYIDVKALYLQTEITNEQLAAVSARNPAVTGRVVARVERDRTFIIHLLRAILNDLRPDFFRRSLFKGLERMLAAAEVDASSIDVNAATAVERQWTKRDGRRGRADAEAKAGPLSVTVEGELSKSREWQERYTQLVVHGIDHQKYVREIAGLLRAAKIDDLYVFLDDFSEIPPAAMRTLVDTVIAPLNNSADCPIRFKIAGYPGQVYLGTIDPSKIDIVELDIDRLYAGPQQVSSVEQGGAGFMSRLVKQRLAVYCPRGSVDTYFEGAKSRDFWRTLFLASSGNPRVLGNLLEQAYERDTLHERKIRLPTIEQASEDYFRQRIWDGLERRSQYLQVAHDERRSLDQLLDLVERMIERSRSQVLPPTTKKTNWIAPPSSHFCIAENDSQEMITLELNFLVSRMASVTRPSDGARQAVYAYNFGLCRERRITYSNQSPDGHPYYLDAAFDYTAMLHVARNGNRIYRCDKCRAEFPMSEERSLAEYDYLCKRCKKGTCKVVTRPVRQRNQKTRRPRPQFTETELSILEELRYSSRPLRPKEIGDAVGASYQLITRRARQLRDRGYVEYAATEPITISSRALTEVFQSDKT